MFYHLCLENFANFGIIKFNEPIDVKDLLKRTLLENDKELLQNALDGYIWSNSFESLDAFIQVCFSSFSGLNLQYITELLYSKSEMLQEYFEIKFIDNGSLALESIPLLIEGYAPYFGKLGPFLILLAIKVSFENAQFLLDIVFRQTGSLKRLASREYVV